MDLKLKVGIGVGALGAVLSGAYALSGKPLTLGSDDSAEHTDEAGAQVRVVESCEGMLNGIRCGKPGSSRLCVYESCITNVCGDSIVAEAEECDDGNHQSSDGCSDKCQWEELASCGDGEIGEREECDDGNLRDDDRCTIRCSVARCGDGAKGPGEACDDGNIDDTDDCTTHCRPPTPEQVLAARGTRPGGSGVAVVGSAGSGAAVDRGKAGSGAHGSEGVSGSGGSLGSSSSAQAATGDAGDDDDDDPEGKCHKCREKHCRNVLGADILAGCLESVNPAFGAPTGDSAFLQQCSEVVMCARESGCAYRAERQAAPCYCGSISVDDCEEKGPAKDAPCVKEWQLATRTSSNNEVLLRFTDLAYPAGWAYQLLDCDRQHCAECQTL